MRGGYKYLKPILDAFDDSSLIIFCSPVYVGHIPGQIKSFLDHFGYRWLVHRPDFKMLKKRAVIIASAGGGGLKATAQRYKGQYGLGESKELILSVKVFGDILGQYAR